MAWPLVNQSEAQVGQVDDALVGFHFCLQTDHVGLEPGWPSWQTETLTIMLFSRPAVREVRAQ